MFTKSLKLTKRRAVALLLMLGVILSAAVVLCSSPRSLLSTGDMLDVSQLKGREKYLASYGWEVAQEPVQTQEVRIPTEPSEVFERYNDLQVSQGFDLHNYAGKSVKRYVYQISNYPDTEDTYYATLLVYKNAVIGGDVSSSAQGGGMHSLCMPK